MSRKRERANERKERLRKQNERSEHGPTGLEHASFAADEANAAVAAGAGSEPGDFTDAELAAAEAADAEERGAPAESASVSTKRGGARFWQFLRACWAELERVRWPDRQQVGQGTAVTLGFVVIAGAFLGGADFAAKRIVELIL